MSHPVTRQRSAVWVWATTTSVIMGLGIGNRLFARPADKPPRQAPTASAPTSAPANAIILFDGKDESKWTEGGHKPLRWKVQDGAMIVTPGTGDAITKDKFTDFRLHMDFYVPTAADGLADRHGNSGVYLQGRYEIQIIDSYGHEPESHQCGALYSIAPPRVNACKPPGHWQSFDITFHAPKFDAQGKMTRKGRVTILQNGVKILEEAEFDHVTPGPTDEHLAQPGPIRLQNYGGAPVRFRNIWLVPLKDG
ncbi:MAG: DUF1080 domain-containing protein [Phycisphaerae bacterium]|nr:DUF1080 domain-containing protein [Phycisphaerae bacterium]